MAQGVFYICRWDHLPVSSAHKLSSKCAMIPSHTCHIRLSYDIWDHSTLRCLETRTAHICLFATDVSQKKIPSIVVPLATHNTKVRNFLESPDLLNIIFCNFCAHTAHTIPVLIMFITQSKNEQCGKVQFWAAGPAEPYM